MGNQFEFASLYGKHEELNQEPQSVHQTSSEGHCHCYCRTQSFSDQCMILARKAKKVFCYFDLPFSKRLIMSSWLFHRHQFEMEESGNIVIIAAGLSRQRPPFWKRVKVILESLFAEHYLDHLFCFQMFLWPLCPTDIKDGKAEEGSWFEKGCEQKKKNYQDFHSGFFYFSWTCQTHQLWWLKWGSHKNLRMTASHWSTLDQLRNHLLRNYWQCRWSKFKC